MSRPSALCTSAGRIIAGLRLVEAIGDDANVELAEILRLRKAEAASSRDAARDAKLGHQQHEVRPRDQRQRPVRPVRRKVEEHRPELARREVDDLEQVIARNPLERHHVRRRGNDLEPARMIGGGGSQQVAVEPRSSFQQVEQATASGAGQAGTRHRRTARRDRSGSTRGHAPPRAAQSGSQAGSATAVAPTPPTLLITLTSFALAVSATAPTCGSRPAAARSTASRSSMLSGKGTTSCAPDRTSARTKASGGS